MKPFNSYPALLLVLTFFVSSCSQSPQSMSDNPFNSPSTLPFEAPDFSKIDNHHYLPAFEAGMEKEMEEVTAIANNPEPPTFENTIVALEKTGELLNRAQSVFYNLTSAHTNDTLQDIQSEMAPRFSAHSDNILLNKQLFERVETLYNDREELALDGASLKLLEDTYRDFVRAGAKLDEEQQQRIRQINEKLSSLTTEFQEKLLEMTKERAVIFDDKKQLKGLSEARIAAAKEAARERGLDDKYLISISNTTRVPVLASLDNREVREKVWKASANRGVGENGGIDTRPIVLELVKLRAEKARILGYQNHAAFVLEEQTAQNPGNALEMLGELVDPVLRNSSAEKNKIAQQMQEDGINGEVQPWDWEYYAEKVRQAEYDINEEEVRAYFELDRVLKDGVFYTMNKLFGITFEERDDLPVYHPDVRVFDVFDEDGEQIGLFYGDFFARSSKRGGAWMNSFVSQSHLLGKQPVIVNVLNIEKPAQGEPALISFDNVTTLFHEMGHAVHGLLSDVKYPSQSGTSVPRDFVEFPSTFQEDWAIHPDILSNYAVHYKTGEAIPQALLQKVIDAQTFNQGFDTQEYLAAALLDMEWHLLEENQVPEEVLSFEKQALQKHDMWSTVIQPRYKSTYFAHIFSGGYSAGYYAYIWSEVLAADAFAYMKENGGPTRENGANFREHILSKGGSKKPMELYKAFRGDEPDVKHLLKRRGLTQ